MIHIYSTSRGKAIKPHFIESAQNEKIEFKFEVCPGAPIATITNHIESDIANQTIKPNSTIYIIAGITNFTNRLKDFNKKYEEVVFIGKEEERKDNIIRKYQHLSDIITIHNCKLSIATIAPSNIHKWNTTRLSQNKTSTLHYINQYPDMQKKIHETVKATNQEIVGLNKENHMYTLFLDKEIITTYKRRSSLVPSYNYSYIDLPDGVLANTKLGKIWAHKLIKTIKKNQSQSPNTFQDNTHLKINNSVHMGSPKRSWRP